MSLFQRIYACSSLTKTCLNSAIDASIFILIFVIQLLHYLQCVKTVMRFSAWVPSNCYRKDSSLGIENVGWSGEDISIIPDVPGEINCYYDKELLSSELSSV